MYTLPIYIIYRKRVVALAAQKFISDIATDALQYCKIRQQGPAYRDKRSAKVSNRSIDVSLLSLLSHTPKERERESSSVAKTSPYHTMESRGRECVYVCVRERWYGLAISLGIVTVGSREREKEREWCMAFSWPCGEGVPMGLRRTPQRVQRSA